MTTPYQSSKICKFIKPRRIKANKQLRDREYLTEQEIELLIKALRKHSRNSLRDETIVTMMFRHGLRVTEVINLKWEQVDLKEGLLHVARIKNGKDSVHPIPGVELRLLLVAAAVLASGMADLAEGGLSLGAQVLVALSVELLDVLAVVEGMPLLLVVGVVETERDILPLCCPSPPALAKRFSNGSSGLGLLPRASC